VHSSIKKFVKAMETSPRMTAFRRDLTFVGRPAVNRTLAREGLICQRTMGNVYFLIRIPWGVACFSRV
jgi:hypothetical protein